MIFAVFCRPENPLLNLLLFEVLFYSRQPIENFCRYCYYFLQPQKGCFFCGMAQKSQVKGSMQRKPTYSTEDLARVLPKLNVGGVIRISTRIRMEKEFY